MRLFHTLAGGCMVLSATLAASQASVEPQVGGSCVGLPPSFYAHAQVANVEVVSRFDYLHNVRAMMSEALGAASVQKNRPFDKAAVSRGQAAIRDRLRKAADQTGLPVTVNVVVGELINCDSKAQPPTLDVLYTAFISWFPVSFSRTFETRNTEANDPARAVNVRATTGFRLLPQASYDATTKWSGGARASLATRAGRLEAGGLASPSAFSFDASDSGRYAWKEGPIRSAEWLGGFFYYDAPAVNGRLKRARLTTQLIANSAPLGTSNAVLRFGVALGGGHDQSTVASPALPTNTLLNSPVGELKAYTGISARTGKHSLKASYALQVGHARTGVQVDFVKHLTDGEYNFRFLPWDHRPIELDTRFNAGWIQNLGAVPAAERFFGGNAEQDFLLGDSWRIREAPFIRSIPQNRLSRLTPSSPFGGDRFVSTNLTLAVTTWRRPLVPDVLRTNPDFPRFLKSEESTAEAFLRSYWSSKDKAVAEILAGGPDAAALIRQLDRKFAAVDTSTLGASSGSFNDCSDQLTLFADSYADTLEKDPSPIHRLAAISSLTAVGDDGSMDMLSDCVQKLQAVLGLGRSDPLPKQITDVRDSLRVAMGKIDKKTAAKKARQDMAFVRNTVDTMVGEMNFASVSPIVVFDAARIGPQPSDAAGGFRYAVGGGLRVTFLDTIRLDGGYSFNPNPKPWEGRGAAFFSLQVLSIFR